MKRPIALLLLLCLLLGMMPVSATTIRSLPADMVAEMTLEEKIGQMIVADFQTWNGAAVTSVNSAIAAAIQKYGFGGVILFGCNTTGTAQTAALTADLQAASKIPLLIATDQEGGYVNRLGTGTQGPGNMALGATDDPACAREAASIIGAELSALGINMNYGPVMDVNNNPDNPIIGIRSFSDDPALTAKMGTAYIEGLHAQGVASALKHFPGHGDTATDSHTGLPCIYKSLDRLRSFELIPFQAGIDAGTDLIMTAHIQYPKIEQETYISKATGQPITLPATLSRTILTDILRGELGYQGVITTDAMNMDAIATHFDRLDAARLAINAGVDLLLMPVVMSNQAGIDDCGKYIAGIADMVRSGKIAEATIDAAVMRILELKLNRGLFDMDFNKTAQVQKALSVVGSKENHEREWAVACKAVTMVKNKEDTLPLKLRSGGNAVVFCSYNNELPAVGYAIDRLKAEGTLPKDASCKAFCYQNHTVSDFGSEIAAADTIVACVETYRAANITGGWQAEFLDALIDTVHAQGKHITIISLQLPYDLARYRKADALLAAYCANGMPTAPTAFNGETPTYGPNLPAAIYGAFGGFIPSGKLPVDIPKLDSQYRYTSTDLYPRGYGITGYNPAAPFWDVKKGSFYAKAVDWAVEANITTGVSEIAFRPGEACTRAQVVTFLWRTAGCPEATAATAFTDVRPGSYYEKAVQWAVEAGITKGVTASEFRPESPCTRGQIVTFLWRYAGKPDAGSAAFADVKAGSYCAKAVDWAVEAGVTKGITETEFRPEQACTRAQTVTFLYRIK